MVDGARFNSLAIERSEAPVLKPLDISSRSVILSVRLERLRSGGRMAPVRDSKGYIEDESRSNRRPIELMLSPRSHRSHMSAFCLSVKYIRDRLAI